HYLETWGDARAYDGTVTIQQPLITPLYNGKSAYELLAAFTDNPDRRGYDIVRQYWLNEGRGALLAGASAAAAGGSAAAGTSGDATVANTTTAVGTAAAGTAAQSGARGAAATPAPAPPQAQGGQAQGGQAQGGAAGMTTPTTTAAASAAPDAAFERAWRRVLNDGFVANSARRPAGGGGGAAAPTNAGDAQGATAPPAAPPAPAQTPAPSGAFEIVFRTDPTVHDGRFANNGWLQELPKPLTKLTWDNVALISPATAERLGVGTEPDGAVEQVPGLRRVNRLTSKGGEIDAETVRLTYRGRALPDAKNEMHAEMVVPVFILPGQPDDVVTVHLGYGRWRAGRVGGNLREGRRGFNAYDLRTSDAMWWGTGLGVEVTGDTYPLACTQIHFRMEGREIVRAGSFADWTRDPTLSPAREHKKDPPQPAGENRAPQHGETMYPPYNYDPDEATGFRGYKWGMAIDVATCVGCNACVVACQAENNIPVVGKEQVARSREMHWLRVDSYFRGATSAPDGVYFMPVPCMHCENAPCEPVCPVHATVHSSEGLNDMVYNRCVGTRYCSNNCPYKVRRFNFLLYQDWDTPSLKMLRNPEVTVRSRGVMEKCTYCVQRIEHAKIEREKAGERVVDGDVKTACQQTCPTESIVFGDLNDPQSRVARLHAQKRRYDLLADLNTRPRTVYLASVRNPNGELGGAAPRPHAEGGHGGEA
ncbi:MAG TPA: 4Fe-4S dicluster domain-containing protein, partial [Pyrinomonadaceae bacterium]